MKSRICQQPLVGSYSNLKLKLIWLYQRVHKCQMKMTSNGSWPKMEDDFKIWEIEYLSNHRSDLTKIWNLSLWDSTKGYTRVKWRWPLMKDDLKWKMTSKYENYRASQKNYDKISMHSFPSYSVLSVFKTGYLFLWKI